MLKNLKITLCFTAVVLFLLAGLALAQDKVDKKETPETVKVGDNKNQTINAFEEFKRLKNLKDPQAKDFLDLGILYEHGLGTMKNYSKALEMYQKAADLKLPEGFYNVAVCYEVGMGATQDDKKALENFQKSSEVGLAQGDYKLASLYLLGQIVKKDDKKAVELLTKAASNKHIEAAADLGAIYATGSLGTKVNRAEAIKYLTIAADQFSPEAMKNLAVVYKDGLGGAKKDYEQALKWYLIASMFGFPSEAIQEALNEITDEIDKTKMEAITNDANKWYQEKTGNKEAPFSFSKNTEAEEPKKEIKK